MPDTPSDPRLPEAGETAGAVPPPSRVGTFAGGAHAPADDETLAPHASHVPVSQGASGGPRNVRSVGPGDRIDRYVIVEQIGEGGFGSVFIAEQKEPIRREVALKVIKAGMDSDQVLGRFEAERQALALMDHTNIAAVYDGGVTPWGGPYFVMELVRGMPISAYCDRHKLSLPERLKIFIDVCRAVQHAHQKGVIHRDIKPSNIIVGFSDGRAIPKVIDFGVAKALHRPLTDHDVHTLQHQPIGTPEYMSPEQAEMSGLDLDTRTDIYSLGVVLYELIAGSTPFDHKTLVSGGYAGMTKVIREKEPPRPSAKLQALEAQTKTSLAAARGASAIVLERALRRDLDWVVLKCLEKDRNRRYESADALAKDVQNFLDDQPVTAGPPSNFYRARKFVRRNRAGVAAASIALIALITGGAAATIGFVSASVQRDRAIDALAQAEAARQESESVTDFLADTLAAADPGAAGRHVTVREVIDQAASRLGPSMEGRPAVESRLRRTIGETYLALGLLDEADAQLPRAYELAKAEQLVADSIAADLATLRAEQGDFEAARRFANEAAATEPLKAARSLARAAEGEGDYQQAAEILKQALADNASAPPPSRIALRADLAQLLRRAGEFEAAETTQREVLDDQRTLLGPAHPESIRSMVDLAAVLNEQGRAEEAEAVYVQARDLGAETLGRRHPTVLEANAQLAQLYASQRRTDEAETIIREVVETREDVLGPTHPDTLTARAILGSVLLRQNKTDEAIEQLTEAAEGKALVLGPDHPSTLTTEIGLANAVRTAGRGDEAARRLEAVLLKHRRVNGPDHPTNFAIALMLASVYENLGELDRAEDVLTENIRQAETSLGPDHPTVALSLANLANVYFGEKRYDEAAETYERADAAIAVARGRTHPQRVFALTRYAAMLDEAGRPVQAACVNARGLLLGLERDPAANRTKQDSDDLLVRLDKITTAEQAEELAACVETLMDSSDAQLPTAVAEALVATIERTGAGGLAAEGLLERLTF